MKSDFIIALTQLAAERNLSREIVLSAIEAALVSAYRRDSVTAGRDISVKLDPGSGEVSVYIVHTVVEEVTDPLQEISLTDARKINPNAAFGDVVPTESLPQTAGRIAAQTAKQVVIQRLREAERELVFEEYTDKEGEVYTVTVQRIEPKQIVVELGRAEAVLPTSEQGPYERYRIGQRMKVLLQSVRRSSKGPEIIVSRADKLLLKRLFEMEVPEIYNGAVEIKGIAREAGFRSKVAVWARQDGVDAVGSCVGLRGIRIQNIVNELHGEKVDVVQWNKDPAAFITSALSPSLVLRVDVDPETNTAVAVVPERQLSLAIGKEGQNARLAARLTGWKVDIKSNVEVEAAEKEKAEVAAPAAEVSTAVAEEIEAAVEAFEAPVEESVAAVPVTAEETPPVQEEPVPEELIGEPIVAEVETEVAAEVEEPEPAVAVEAAQDLEVPSEIPTPEDLVAEAVDDVERATEEELVAASADSSASIHDLPEDIWSTRNKVTPESGVIRFAEDIEELATRGSRRGGRGGNRTRTDNRSRGRKSKAGGRR